MTVTIKCNICDAESALQQDEGEDEVVVVVAQMLTFTAAHHHADFSVDVLWPAE